MAWNDVVFTQTTAQGGTVRLNAASGNYSYVPAPSAQGVLDSFTYQATDNVANSAPATVTLTVTARLSIPTNLTGSVGGTVVVNRGELVPNATPGRGVRR